MKAFLVLSVCLGVLGAEIASAATYRVKRSYPQGGPKLKEPTVVRFSLYQGTSETPLTASDLKLEHEKLIHLMTLDAGFTKYLHEHPTEVSPGVWEVPLTVDVPGRYRVWMQFLPEDEVSTKTVFFDDAFLENPGQTVPTTPVSTAEKLSGNDGGYRLTVTLPPGGPLQHSMVPLKVTVHKDGKGVPPEQLENYLGAKFHLAGVSADRRDFIHSHPGHTTGGRDRAAPEIDVIRAHFMQTGYYGLFVQFQHEGKVRTVQLGILVRPQE